MSKYRYQLRGAGNMGVATAYDLVKHCEADSVVIIDPNLDQLKRAKARLQSESLLGKQEARLTYLTEPGTRGESVVVSCASHTANIDIAKWAMDRKIPYCDLGGSHDVAAAIKGMAYGAKSPIVVECGYSPGLASIIAVHLVKKHGCNRIETRCGGNPHKRPDPKKNPLLYKLTWSPAGLAHEYAHKAMTIQNSRLVAVRALSKIEKYDDIFEWAPTSNNSYFIADYLRELGVEWFDYGTLRYHGHFRAVFGDKRQFDEEEFVKRVLSMPVLKYDRERDMDRALLIVEGGKGTRSHKQIFRHRIDITADPNTRFTAMELMTSWGIAIVAHHMASGRGKPLGFATPEMFVDSDWVLAEIDRRLKLYNMQ